MIKKLFLSIASLFLIWQSYTLVLSINDMGIDHWVLLILMSWLINLFITGVFAFAGFAFPTQKLLPDSYYYISDPEQLKKWYQVLKVDVFRKLLLATLWKSKKQRKTYFDGKKLGISNLIKQSMKSEFGHLIPFIIVNLLCVHFLYTGLTALALLSFGINCIGNFYPIILQRHHRMRIQSIREKSMRSNSNKKSRLKDVDLHI